MEDEVLVLNDSVNESTKRTESPSTDVDSNCVGKTQTNNDSNPTNDETLKKLIMDAIESASEEDGWANLGGVGSYIPRVDSSFDPRNYGFSKLGKLIMSLDYVKSELRTSENGHQNVYVQFHQANAKC